MRNWGIVGMTISPSSGYFIYEYPVMDDSTFISISVKERWIPAEWDEAGIILRGKRFTWEEIDELKKTPEWWEKLG